ncbi:MAG TPA: hypothetical protein DEH00_03575 [Candidatus Marinimicrobia bacterium]|nr:hypothetical protein [Candidatus Neomarinimicrobiota bacterium]
MVVSPLTYIIPTDLKMAMDNGNEILAHYHRLLIQRQYSEHTIKTYTGYFKAFVEHFGAGKLLW